MQTQQRILYIIERLIASPCTSKELTQDIYAVEDEGKRRLIQNDLKLLKKFYPKTLVVRENKFYQFIKAPSSIRSVVTKEGMETQDLLEFLLVFNSKMLTLFEREEPKLIGHLKKEIASLYHVLEEPFEEFKSPFLEDIKRAIKQCRYVFIGYDGKKEIQYYKKNQIYKIVYAEHNWYIVVYSFDKEYKDYRLLRINFIRELTFLSTQFKRDIRVENFTNNLQSLFPSYDTAPYEIILKVEPIVMKNFIAKKHLRSQETIEKKEDGLYLRFWITNDMEILPLIKKWIPNIKIVSAPQNLKKTLKKDLLVYLDGL